LITKAFEIRDRATFIPVLATKLDTVDLKEEEAYLIRKSGFGRNYQHILVTKLIDGETQTEHDAGYWQGLGRTMGEAHRYINEHFDELQPGAVIDVEFILGETTVCKVSERLK
jgi:hypothetical protein